MHENLIGCFLVLILAEKSGISSHLTVQLWRLSVPLSLHVLFLKSVKSCSVYQVTDLWESVLHCKYY